MSSLVGVPAHVARTVESSILPYIERCLKKGKEHRWNAQDVLDRIYSRDMQLWVVSDDGLKGVIVTEILEHPRCKEMNIFVYNGNLKCDWRQHLDELCEWAKEQGCQAVSTTTRRGFVKVLGWEARQTYVVKGLR